MVNFVVAVGLTALSATHALEEQAFIETCAAGDEACVENDLALLQTRLEKQSEEDTEEQDKKKPRASLADSAANEKARTKLVIEKDLSKLEDKYYRAYREEETCFENAKKAYDEFVATSELAKELTKDELAAFEERFLSELDYYCKHDPLIKYDWTLRIKESMQHEKPAFTKALAESLTDANLAYEVKVQPWMVHESQRTLKERCGKKSSDEEKNTIMAQTEVFLSQATVDNSKIPDSFDSRTEWPECSDVVGRIYNQGVCGSCWAFGGLSSADSRLCIATGGEYQGQLSRGYSASCATQNGCKGGMSSYIWTLLSSTGIPTGGDQGCKPYFGTGEGTDHFELDQAAPPCPSECQASYGRSLAEDRFVVPAFSNFQEIWPTNTNGNNLAKESMMKYGPLSFGINADNAMFGYSSGIFDSGCGADPNHEVVAIGWGIDYWIGLNSWGEDWGEAGSFKTATCTITDWTIPAGITAGDTTGVPLPLPTSSQTAAPAASFEWSVSGACTIDDQGCISSGNYPLDYANGGKCTITNAAALGVIEVDGFNTEIGYDVLTVNGEKYSGTTGPHGVTPTADITWQADSDLAAMGWKICPGIDDAVDYDAASYDYA
eukprot:TRINITY_DN5914_c0_g2_i1.p1 TRINITY_DN5914_c0_g2~~TRINITY_DN5914_c0_g2_i1.p1  ORF type:complete len:607 (-),score=127.06 TRINITY_DN5914_c0_g2_i1:202-2022(-)